MHSFYYVLRTFFGHFSQSEFENRLKVYTKVYPKVWDTPSLLPGFIAPQKSLYKVPLNQPRAYKGAVNSNNNRSNKENKNRHAHFHRRTEL